jgi:2TM domain
MSEHGTTRTIDLDAHERELRDLAVDRIRRRRNFFTHLVAHLGAIVLLTAIWATTEYHNAGGWPTGFRTGRENHDWDPWIVYPLIALHAGLAVHAWVAFGRGPTTRLEIEREMDRLRAGGVRGY